MVRHWIQDIHYSGYSGRETLLDLLVVVTTWKGNLYIVNWAYERIIKTQWWQQLSEWIKSKVHPRILTNKFWTRDMKNTVKQLFGAGNPYNSIAAYLYRCFGHKIRTSTLIRKAVRLRWLYGKSWL